MNRREARRGRRATRWTGVALCATLLAGLLLIGLDGAVLARAEDSYGCRQGYRQQSVISDFALGRVWEVYASCTHPEGPRVALILDRTPADRTPADRTPADRAPADQSSAPAVPRGIEEEVSSAPPVVRSGTPVRLWLSSSVARIALSGVALENGASGATIRVRVLPGGKVLDGTVRSADSVELLAAGFDGAAR